MRFLKFLSQFEHCSINIVGKCRRAQAWASPLLSLEGFSLLFFFSFALSFLTFLYILVITRILDFLRKV